jgi:hypothetical protein
MCKLLVDIDYTFNKEAFLYFSGIEVCCQQLSNAIFDRCVIKIRPGHDRDGSINPILYSIIKDDSETYPNDKLYLFNCPFCGEKIKVCAHDMCRGVHQLEIKDLGHKSFGPHTLKIRGVTLEEVLRIKKMRV